MRTDGAASPTPTTGSSGGASNAVTATRAAYRLRAGDPIYIFLRDLPGARTEQQLEDVIDDSGTVNLPLVGRIIAVGKTTSELESDIEQKYLDEKIYVRRLTVNVVVPQQLVFVTGEVKLPNQYRLVSGMTLTQAIATSGGYTEFADPTKVKLIRANNTTVLNALEIAKHPDKDIQLEVGDQIVVPRSWY